MEIDPEIFKEKLDPELVKKINTGITSSNLTTIQKMLTDIINENDKFEREYSHQKAMVNDYELEFIHELAECFKAGCDEARIENIFQEKGITNTRLINELLQKSVVKLDSELPGLFRDLNYAGNRLRRSLITVGYITYKNCYKWFKRNIDVAGNSPYFKNLFLFIHLLIVFISVIEDCLPHHVLSKLFNTPYIGGLFYIIHKNKDVASTLFRYRAYYEGLKQIINTFPFTRYFKDKILEMLADIFDKGKKQTVEATGIVEESIAISVAEEHFKLCVDATFSNTLREFLNGIAEGAGIGRPVSPVSTPGSTQMSDMTEDSEPIIFDDTIIKGLYSPPPTPSSSSSSSSSSRSSKFSYKTALEQVSIMSDSTSSFKTVFDLDQMTMSKLLRASENLEKFNKSIMTTMMIGTQLNLKRSLSENISKQRNKMEEALQRRSTKGGTKRRKSKRTKRRIKRRSNRRKRRSSKR